MFENFLSNASYRKKWIEFNECGLHFDIELFLRKRVLTLDGVWILPKRRQGMKKLLAFLFTQGEFLDKIVIGKVINPHLAEYLAREGWVLKADGKWINFEKKLN